MPGSRRLAGTVEVRQTAANAEEEIMTIVAWLVVGIIAGLVARAVVPGEIGGGLLTDLGVGIVGAILGGWLGSMFLGTGHVTGINVQSIIIAICGALVLLFILRVLTPRRGI